MRKTAVLKSLKRLAALLAAVLLAIPLNITAFAAGSTTATVPVTLTVANEYRAVNVTVPASLPVYVINGTVMTADSAKIINNSHSSPIQVTSVKVTDGSYKVGSYDGFSGSNSIALKINGCVTKGPGEVTISTNSFPVIKAGGSLTLTYFAKVSGDAENAEAVNAASVIFTISIVN